MTGRIIVGRQQRLPQSRPWRVRIGCCMGVIAGSLGLDCGGDGVANYRNSALSEVRLETAGGPSSPGLAGANAGQTMQAGTGQIPISGSAGGESTPPAGSEAPVVSSFAWISEVKFDPPGTDGNYEFIELRGQPGTTLARHWLVSIEGDLESNRGQVDNAIDLSTCGAGSCQFDNKGLLLLVADPSATVPPTGSAWSLSSELAKAGLENGTTSLWVVVGPWAGTTGADWDSNDDGVLELPPDLLVTDSVAWTDGDTGDATYASVALGPKPKPQSAWSCEGNAGSRVWRYGQLLGESPSLAVDVLHSFPEGLEAFDLSPGGINRCQVPLPVESVPSNAGSAGNAGVPSPVFTAGCGGTLASGGVALTTSGSSTATGGHGGTTAASSGSAGVNGATSMGGWAGPSTIPGSELTVGGGVATSLNTNSSGTSGGTESAAGCGGSVMPQVVPAPAVALAGNSGWWTPNPFVAARGGQSAPGGNFASAGVFTGRGSSGAAAPPPMPSGCTLNPRPVVPRSVLPMIGLAGIAVRRRRSVQHR